MTQFTANEVRELAATIWPDLSGREEVAEALNAFADLLEAREKAVPVAWMERVVAYGIAGDIPATESTPHAFPVYAHPPAASVPDAMQELADKYHELLWAVARKFPGETRHETALRYIREAECQEAALAAQENLNG